MMYIITFALLALLAIRTTGTIKETIKYYKRMKALEALPMLEQI